MTPRHILVLGENPAQGQDYFLADIHGNAELLESAIVKTTENDRLFIMGDLIDKGDDSPEVMRLIKLAQDKYPASIYVIRGNHESMCIRSIPVLESIAHILAQIPEDSIEEGLDIILSSTATILAPLKHHLQNGGEWLAFLFREELAEGLIRIEEHGNERRILYDQFSLVGYIKSFMNSLPVILYLDTKIPAKAVHADMPFSDAELMRRIGNEQWTLSDEELAYATESREEIAFKNVLRKIQNEHHKPDDIITYVGHTIISAKYRRVVRYESNHINTDIGATFKGIALMVNHSAAECEFVTDKDNPPDFITYPFLIDIAAELNLHLAAVRKRYIPNMQEEEVETWSESDDSGKKRGRSPSLASQAGLFKDDAAKRSKIDQKGRAFLINK